MFNIKNISAMLLVIFLAIACKNSDKKNELSPAEELECSEWRDAKWKNSLCVINENDTLKLYFASIYALLSNPDFFDKKLVQTCGYFTGDITSEDCSIWWALYPSKEDALNNLFTNELSIELTREDAEAFRHMELPYGMYTCLRGTFSLYARSIGRVYRLEKNGLMNANIIRRIGFSRSLEKLKCKEM